MGIVVTCFLGVLDVYDSTGEEILGNGPVVVEIPYYTSLKILVTFTSRSPVTITVRIKPRLSYKCNGVPHYTCKIT